MNSKEYDEWRDGIGGPVYAEHRRKKHVLLKKGDIPGALVEEIREGVGAYTHYANAAVGNEPLDTREKSHVQRLEESRARGSRGPTPP